METANRTKGNPLVNSLFQDYHKFDFYQAVKLLEVIYRNSLNEKDQKLLNKKKDDYLNPANSIIKFRSSVRTNVPSGDVDKISLSPNQKELFEMVVNFMGLAGIQGPLPAHYTQFMLDLENSFTKDTALREFLDIFNHRLLTLLYDTRKEHRIGYKLCYPEETKIAYGLLSFIGFGTLSKKDKEVINERLLLNYAGIFLNSARSIAGLEFILSDFFDINFKIKSFTGRWENIPLDQRTYIGKDDTNQSLGKTAILGRKFWDPSLKFDLYAGPIDNTNLIDFLPLPGSESFHILTKIIRYYIGPEYEFNIILKVNTQNVPAFRLGESRLGWTSWIPFDDQDDITDDDEIQPKENKKLRMKFITRNDQDDDDDEYYNKGYKKLSMKFAGGINLDLNTEKLKVKRIIKNYIGIKLTSQFS